MPSAALPPIALSVRQPWTWAILHAKKTHENRTEASIRLGNMRALVGSRIAIHAGKGMTRDEYEEASDFIRRLAGDCPAAHELARGGIVGSVRVAGLITTRREGERETSPWFFGPCALILADPEPCDFIGAAGELGMFKWKPNGLAPDAPAKWMLPKPVQRVAAVESRVPGQKELL